LRIPESAQAGLFHAPQQSRKLQNSQGFAETRDNDSTIIMFREYPGMITEWKHRLDQERARGGSEMATTNTIRIDACGMKCPRPIVELAKAKRQAEPGAILVITADDLAFESDVKAWCETTGSLLVELVKDGPVHTATIELQEEQ